MVINKYWIILLFQNLVFSQAISDSTEVKSISSLIQIRCFENLTPIKEFENYPNWKNAELCTLIDAIVLLEFKSGDKEFDDRVHLSFINRLREIAGILFNEKSPVLLVSGMDSSFDANKENINILDDDNVIYVSIGECIIPKSWHEAKEIFNSETRMLLKK